MDLAGRAGVEEIRPNRDALKETVNAGLENESENAILVSLGLGRPFRARGEDSRVGTIVKVAALLHYSVSTARRCRPRKRHVLGDEAKPLAVLRTADGFAV